MEIEESTPAPEAVPEPVEEHTPAPEPVESVDPPEPVEPSPVAEEQVPEDPFTSYGGKDEVEKAVKLWQATQTEDGTISLFLEAGRNLGLSLADMQRLFQIEAGEQPEAEEVDLDEPVTRRELLEQQQQREQAAIQQEAARIHAAARTAVDKTMEELGVTDNDTRALVLTLGEKHFDQKNISAESAAAAVRAGFSEYQALIERQTQQYLRTKQEAAESVPQAPSGAGPTAAPPEPEPQNVAEAIKQARKKLGLSSS